MVQKRGLGGSEYGGPVVSAIILHAEEKLFLNKTVDFII